MVWEVVSCMCVRERKREGESRGCIESKNILLGSITAKCTCVF